jgi:hypothetical protein
MANAQHASERMANPDACERPRQTWPAIDGFAGTTVCLIVTSSPAGERRTLNNQCAAPLRWASNSAAAVPL